MERKDRKTAKSIFPACIYLLHTELNGKSHATCTCSTRSQFTMSSTECTHQSRWEKVRRRVWPLQQVEWLVGTVKQQQQLMGGERCNTREWDRQYVLSIWMQDDKSEGSHAQSGEALHVTSACSKVIVASTVCSL